RQAEVGRRDEDENRDAEVQPEEEGVERAEHPQTLRHGLDSPRWCLDGHRSLPSLVRTRSGSTGVISAPRRGAPRPNEGYQRTFLGVAYALGSPRWRRRSPQVTPRALLGSRSTRSAVGTSRAGFASSATGPT